MPRFFYDPEHPSRVYVAGAAKEEVSREDAHVIALIELGNSLRQIVAAQNWLGLSDEERAEKKRILKVLEDSMGDQFKADRQRLKSIYDS